MAVPAAQRLPASAKTAHARRTGGIDEMIADLGMRLIDAAIKLPVEEN